jgi:hypothetical protein
MRNPGSVVFVGLDVHKDSIAVAYAPLGGEVGRARHHRYAPI